MRGLFVTGTDTGVGKSILTAALLAAAVAAGERARAFKPAVTGLEELSEEPGAGAWPPDHELLASVTGVTGAEVSPYLLAAAASPRFAAALAGERIELDVMLARARELAADGTLIVEGVGGLLVPLTERHSVRDLAAALGLGLLVAARPGLGTINHTLLTLEAARAASLDVRAVVLTPWPLEPTALERSNRDTIAELGGVEVHTLGWLAGADARALADAGGRLPWRAWLAARGGGHA